MSTSCWCSCDVCYCGPNCRCTETLCRCEASSVLNSLGVQKPVSRGASSKNLVPASWKVEGLTCCSGGKIEAICSNSGQVQQFTMDIQLGVVNALVEGIDHAQQIMEDMGLAGFSAKLENVGKPVDGSNGKTNPTIDLLATPSSDVEAGLSNGTSGSQKQVKSHSAQVVEIVVGGMTCSMCSNAVTSALTAMSGVREVNVSLATNVARVEFEASAECTAKILQDEIEDIGYTVEDVILPGRTKIIDFSVGGMTCSMCTNAIKNALSANPDVNNVSISLAENNVQVTYRESPGCHPALLQETIEDIGYEVNNVSGPHESQQSNDPEERLERLILQQEEHLRERKWAFLWSLVGTFPILVLTMVVPYILPESNVIRSALAGKVNILHHDFILESLILCALATPVQFGSGYVFYKSSYYGVFVQGVLGMDVLVALGITASYGYAGYATWVRDHEYHFFETSAVLICFVLLGKWMNALAVRRTSEALTQLMKLQPKTAIMVSHRKAENSVWNPLEDPYEEKIVPVQRLYPGDVVKVLKGASIPVDGVVIHGEMSVDESMITGESIPLLKTPGSIVLGGTICVESGSDNHEATDVTAAAFVEVVGVGSSTALAQIVQLVQDAQSRQVPIQNFADTVSSIFVPTVVTISLLTYMVWYALCNGGAVPPEWHPHESASTFSLMFSIACLVISCPCALGLATPTAVMVGTGVSARHGVLMKGGETLELASRVDSVVFDKTGTLTLGKPAITDFLRMVPDSHVIDINDDSKDKADLTLSDETLLWLLGSLERNSEHPLATAIVSYAERKLGSSKLNNKPFVQPTNFRALTGRGASGTIDGTLTVSVGNRAFADLMGLKIPEDVEVSMQSLERRGKTAILAAVNGRVYVVLGIADELKPDASNSISYLTDMGVDVWMVTGDNKRTANAIARKLNLPYSRVIAEALPVSKVEHVKKLKAQGHVVAMIGDGVNDSPALAEADVGISMGTGAEIAVEASDMVLVRGHVADVCTAMHLSRVIFRRIKLNFLWALIYNCLSIPLAAGAFFPIFHVRLPPTVAAVAMALSSISVVCSSLALRLYNPPHIPSIQPSEPTSSGGSSRGQRRSSWVSRVYQPPQSQSGGSSNGQRRSSWLSRVYEPPPTQSGGSSNGQRRSSWLSRVYEPPPTQSSESSEECNESHENDLTEPLIEAPPSEGNNYGTNSK